jgi:hypothetical protein
MGWVFSLLDGEFSEEYPGVMTIVMRRQDVQVRREIENGRACFSINCGL